MRRKWQLRRQVSEQADAQRRWDLAYQRLLKWSQKEQQVEKRQRKEGQDNAASCPLCPSVHAQSGSSAND